MDTYFDPFKCVERLYSEYMKHKQLIVAIDFDDTVFDYHNGGTNHELVLSLLKECSDLGFYIVICTASSPHRYDMMKEYFIKYEINVHSLNKNPIDLPFGNHGKIYYNILLDDRAGLYTAYITLKETVERIKEHRNEISNN